MTDDDFDRILDEADPPTTGVEQHRYLCTEHRDREGYRELVRRIVTQGGHPPAPAVTVHYGERTQGGCGGCPGSAR